MSEWRILAFNNGGITDYIQKDLELGVDLSVRTAADGDEIALEVRGKQNQTWEWHATSFARELI